MSRVRRPQRVIAAARRGLAVWWGRRSGFGFALLLGVLAAACQEPVTAENAEVGPAPSVARRGLACEVKLSHEREVVETAAPGSPRDNVRRYYEKRTRAGETQRILLCRELDSNYDGVMDVVRAFDEEGRRKTEAVDSNYDGRVDTWLTFSGGRVSTLSIDKNGDGKADEKRFFVEGRLARIQQDRNGDGQPDRFEIYRDDRLERVGVDADFDGRVDRWERDASGLLEEGQSEGETRDRNAATSGAESGAESEQDTPER